MNYEMNSQNYEYTVERYGIQGLRISYNLAAVRHLQLSYSKGKEIHVYTKK
jgi:hypothetical protein